MSESIWSRIEESHNAPKCDLTGAGPAGRINSGSADLTCAGGGGAFYEAPDTRDQCIPGCEGVPMVGFNPWATVSVGRIGVIAIGQTQETCPRRSGGVSDFVPKFKLLPTEIISLTETLDT